MKPFRWRLFLSVLLLCVAMASPALVALAVHVPRPHPPFWPIPDDPDAAARAQLVNKLLPLIRQANQHLQEEHRWLLDLRTRLATPAPLVEADAVRLSSLAQTYQLSALTDTNNLLLVTRLLRRVDRVPADLLLAQAALESDWGRSQAAIEGNNYFGLWCFTAGCGQPPQDNVRAGYEIQYFASITDNLDTWLLNLNTHSRYRSLRELRTTLRNAGKPATGLTLSHALSNGTEVRQLIRTYHLDRFASLLTPPVSR